MDRFTDRLRSFSVVRVGLFLLAGYLLLSATSAAATRENEAKHSQNTSATPGRHICDFPEFNVTQQQTNCDALAAAYAIAVAKLQDAIEAADRAYEDWYECELGNEEAKMQGPVISAEYSVLVDE